MIASILHFALIKPSTTLDSFITDELFSKTWEEGYHHKERFADLKTFTSCLSEKVESVFKNNFVEMAPVEHHICEDTCIYYVHIFKSAGTFTASVLRQYCRRVTGNKTVACLDINDPICQQCGARTKYFTVVRDPIERFLSSSFEVLKRRLEREKKRGSNSFKAFSTIGENSTSDERLQTVLEEFMWSPGRVDNHLKPQISFLNHQKILDALEYVIPYSSFGAGRRSEYGLEELVIKVVGNLFVESKMSNWSHSDSEMYEPILLKKFKKEDGTFNPRSRLDTNYSVGVEAERILTLFRNLSPNNMSDDVLQLVKNIYSWDISSFTSCGFEDTY